MPERVALRVEVSLEGLAQLKDCVDSVIAIPNDRLLQTVARNTPAEFTEFVKREITKFEGLVKTLGIQAE